MKRHAFVLLALAAACGSPPNKDGPVNGTPNGDPNNANAVVNNVNSAQNVVANNAIANNGSTVIGLDEPCDGNEDFTGTAVLSWFDERYDATLVYTADEVTTPLELRFELGDEILCFPHVSPPEGSLAPEQPARLEIAVMMEVRSEDGAFDERLTATVTANAFSAEAGVFFGGSIPSTSFGGAYDIDPQARYGFTGSASVGESNGTIQETVGNSVTPIARWPATF